MEAQLPLPDLANQDPQATGNPAPHSSPWLWIGVSCVFIGNHLADLEGSPQCLELPVGEDENVEPELLHYPLWTTWPGVSRTEAHRF